MTAGSGTNVAADDISSVYYQRVKTTLGPDGTNTADWAGRALPSSAGGAAYVDSRVYRQVFTITPTITAGAYTSGDCLGGLNTIASAARATGYGGVIEWISILDKTQAQRSAMELLFFADSVTGAGDNNPVAFSDADMANRTGVPVSILTTNYNTAWPGTPLNSIAYLPDTKVAANPTVLAIPYHCAATSLYLQLVVRGTPTYTTTSDIVVQLGCVLD